MISAIDCMGRNEEENDFDDRVKPIMIPQMQAAHMEGDQTEKDAWRFPGTRLHPNQNQKVIYTDEIHKEDYYSNKL